MTLDLPARPLFAYVSNHESGDIAAYALATDSGQLAPLPRVPAGRGVMPLAASPDGRFLYAAVRAEPFELRGYAVDPASGALQPIDATPLPESMVSIAVDRSGRWLIAAAYAASELLVFAIDAQGRVPAQPVQRLASGGIKPHTICLDAANRCVYVPHLGTDEVRVYGFEARTGTLAPSVPAQVRLQAGTGPRHLVLSPDQRFLYVLGQLDGCITVLHRDPDSGALAPVQVVDSVPPGSGLRPGRPRPPSGSAQTPPPETEAFWCADIQIRPQGDFLYTTERARSTVSVLAVDRASGHLRLLGCAPTEKQPRAIALDPQGRFLLVSGEASPSLSLYAIDAGSGALAPQQQVPTGAGANWVLFAAPLTS